MSGLGGLLCFGVFVGSVVVAVLALKAFDGVAGRGPKQVKDGVRQAAADPARIPCPKCAELILPAATICPFCRSEVVR